jgi:hypothetical protein
VAHLWLIDPPDVWTILQLDHDAYALNVHPPAPVVFGAAGFAPLAELAEHRRYPRSALVRAPMLGGPGWALLAERPGEVHVNGLPVQAGVKVVADRDEIRFAGQPSMFFSTEALAKVAPFPGAAQPLFCPRCKQAIAAGTPSVQCPHCLVWHHQSDDLPCWTYATACSCCDQPTALDAGFAWTPEDR